MKNRSAILLAPLIGIAPPLAAQTPAASNVARADFIKMQDGEFGKMDADKNGQVTRAEVEGFQRAIAVANSRARLQARFNQLDKDKNGQLSIAEFAAIDSGPPPANGAPFMAKMDGNKDGKITLIEHRAGKLANFDRIDVDKDGVVTAAEMKAAGIR